MNKETVIFVSDEGLGGVVGFGASIHKAGYTPILLTGKVDSDRLSQWSGIFAEIKVIDNPYDPNEIVHAALDLAHGREIKALFSCFDGTVIPAAKAARTLGVPSPDILGLIHCRNKYAMRQCTQNAGLPTPKFSLIQTIEEAAEISANVGYPAVIKPVNGMASHLVRLVHNEEELTSYYREFKEKLKNNFQGNYDQLIPLSEEGGDSIDPEHCFLVEEYITGKEFCAEVIIYNGHVHRVALFQKILEDQRQFLEYGCTNPPVDINAEQQEEIWRHIEQSLHAVGLNNCASHVELKYTSSGPRLIEINAGRAGGSIIVKAVMEINDLNLIDEILSIQSRTFNETRQLVPHNQRISILSLFPQQDGILIKIHGAEDLQKLKGVKEVILFSAPGDVIDASDKEVFSINLLVEGLDIHELEELHKQAREAVTFEISPIVNIQEAAK